MSDYSGVSTSVTTVLQRSPLLLYFRPTDVSSYDQMGLGAGRDSTFLPGIAVAASTVCHREIRAVISRKNSRGCFDGIHRWVLSAFAFTSNTDRSLDGIADKAELVKATVEGSAL